MRQSDIEKRERLAKRNDSIRSDYAIEYRKGYRLEPILETLKDKYALSVATLEDIVFSRGKYKEFWVKFGPMESEKTSFNPFSRPDGSPLPGKLVEWSEWQKKDAQRRLDAMEPEARDELLKRWAELQRRWQSEEDVGTTFLNKNKGEVTE